tara:strand:+ start:740 stop:1120 length:381 start_codon:yes stop_codon:yes gene_type:complete
MKWELKERKANPATGKIQEYKIIVETTKGTDTIEAKVSVPPCPRGQRPTSWHSSDVSNWLKEKGLDIDKPLTSKTLTDVKAMTKTFTFSLKKKKKIPVQAKTTRSRSKKMPIKKTLTTSAETESEE